MTPPQQTDYPVTAIYFVVTMQRFKHRRNLKMSKELACVPAILTEDDIGSPQYAQCSAQAQMGNNNSLSE